MADTTVFEALLDPSNTSKAVYADRGYPSAERESALKQAGWHVHIQRRGHATKGISAAQKRRNRRIATPRARVEHVFGALAQMGGKLVRCLGIVRNLRVAPQSGQLQLEAARLLERTRAATVLNSGGIG